MRIVLVRTWKSWTFEHDVTTQPLGLMYVAAALRAAQPHHEIFIVDPFLERLSVEQVATRVLALDPGLLGLSVLTGEAKEASRLLEMVKTARPEVTTVLGGPHAMTSPHRILEDPNLDVLVFGEGEATFVELVARLDAGEKWPEIPGVAFRRRTAASPTVYIGAPRTPIDDLDSLPMPSWDLIDIRAYWREQNMNAMVKHPRYMSIFTSRGCPYRCTYCHQVFGKRFRQRSAHNVLAEIRALYERYDIREIHILDDIFNADRARAKTILRDIAQSGMKLSLAFPNGLRGDRMDSELIRLMRDAGTYKVAYAVESAAPRIQELIRKRLHLERVRDVIAETSDAGILTHGFFMLGFPTETRAELATTIEWARTSKLHFANFFAVNPFEGTPLANALPSSGIECDFSDPEKYNYHEPRQSIAAVSLDELRASWRHAYSDFYLHPTRVARILRDLPSLRTIPAHAAMVLARVLGLRRLASIYGRTSRSSLRSSQAGGRVNLA